MPKQNDVLNIKQAAPSVDSEGRALIDFFLIEQQELSAVERFSRLHDDVGATPLQEQFYRDLIPLSAPQPGQQYAFEVELDACTGCKACVTACHSMNGLDDDEVWRTVGLLKGGNENLPIFQMVTAACHHCAHPACMIGCPVNAYEKDQFTGIVKHLDDQCIGCQYCVLKCPYDVPKYNPKRGIVRKCDMCSSRLAEKEAPACVQACPNKAIRIAVVDMPEVADRALKNDFLPGTVEAEYTQPTTRYKRRNPLPYNTVAIDQNSATPEHAHSPLVFMLVLTQISIGAFTVDLLAARFGQALLLGDRRPVFVLAAAVIGFLGLNTAILHLGRPLYAFRAVLNFKRSWMSREIVALSVFMGASMTFAAAYWVPRVTGIHVLDGWESALRVATVVSGLVGAFCSMMIYIDTRREFWKASQTLVKFTLTGALLGLSLWTLFALLNAFNSGAAMSLKAMFECVAALSVLKLGFEAVIFLRLRKSSPFHSLQKSARLMAHELKVATSLRFVCGLLGGVILPVALGVLAVSPGAALGLGAASFAFLAAGEILERYLYFSAVVALKMPGGSAA